MFPAVVFVCEIVVLQCMPDLHTLLSVGVEGTCPRSCRVHPVQELHLPGVLQLLISFAHV